MNEIEMALLRHEQRKGNTPSNTKNFDDMKWSRLFTKILLSVIFVLISTIYMKLDPANLEYFKKQFFESNFTFTKINNWYHDMFGSILPSVTEPKSSMVHSNKETLEKQSYLDGYKVSSSKGIPISTLQSGILVFMGEKEGYGNTFIVQGVDGVDIWYGGLKDTNLKLYDYIDQNTILGNTTEDFYCLVFQKDGKALSYEEYIEQMAS